jgi:hypothetical protein
MDNLEREKDTMNYCFRIAKFSKTNFVLGNLQSNGRGNHEVWSSNGHFGMKRRMT